MALERWSCFFVCLFVCFSGKFVTGQETNSKFQSPKASLWNMYEKIVETLNSKLNIMILCVCVISLRVCPKYFSAPQIILCEFQSNHIPV